MLREYINQKYQEFKMYDPLDDHLPWYKQPTNWIRGLFGSSIALLLTVIIMGLVSVITFIVLFFTTEVVVLPVKQGKMWEKATIQHWEWVTHNHKTSVPHKAELLDEWESCDDVCMSRNEEGTCTWWTESCTTYYKYRIMEWVTKRQPIKWKSLPYEETKYSLPDQEWRVLYHTQPKAKVQYKWTETWINSKRIVTGCDSLHVLVYPYRKPGKRVKSSQYAY